MIPMIMRPYLTHGSLLLSPFLFFSLHVPEIQPGEEIQPLPRRPSGWKQCRRTLPRRVYGTVPSAESRSNSPNYKIIILRLAPPGNTRDQTWTSILLSASFAMFAVFAAPLLIFLLPSDRPRSFPPAFVLRSVRFSSILVDCPTRRARSLRDARENARFGTDRRKRRVSPYTARFPSKIAKLRNVSILFRCRKIFRQFN